MSSDFLYVSAVSQVQHVLREIKCLQASEFPYSSSKEALDILHNIFSLHSGLLIDCKDGFDESIEDNVCGNAVFDCAACIDTLGFVLRSTNVRNSFEIYGPFLRLSKSILGDSVKLIVSSEWGYSPFIKGGGAQLPDFVLMGLPATQSSNSFLLPIAGHELGHTIWNKERLDKKLSSLEINECIVRTIQKHWDSYVSAFPELSDKKNELFTDLFARSSWGPIYDWVKHQLQESFCDIVGVGIFGASYYYATAYLLVINKSLARKLLYPDHYDRIRIIADICKQWGVNIPEDYLNLYSNAGPPNKENTKEAALLFVADIVRDEFIGEMRLWVEKILKPKNFAVDSDVVNLCKSSFAFGVPSENAKGLQNILAAAWDSLLDEGFVPGGFEDKEDLLNEIVLKSIEILEIEQLIND